MFVCQDLANYWTDWNIQCDYLLWESSQSYKQTDIDWAHTFRIAALIEIDKLLMYVPYILKNDYVYG